MYNIPVSSPAAPLVSVAICVHNGARYIAETLDSVLAQTLSDFEVVVIDDGSTDGSAGLIERQFADSRIRVFRQPHLTLRGARPAALRNARGTYVAFVDHDDVWLPHKLERQAAEAERTDAALVFSDCFLIGPDGRALGRLSGHRDFAAIDLERSAVLELLRKGCFVPYSTAFARMDAVRAAGGFSTSYQYVSDYDLWLKLARRHRVVCIREPLAKYRVHDAQFTQSRRDITLPEHAALLRPYMRSASYPAGVRLAIRDNLFGQHRLGVPSMLRQRRWRSAARAAAGMLRYPIGIRDYAGHVLGSTPLGAPLRIARGVWRRASRAVREGSRRASNSGRRPVWIDGSSLGEAQTGYFALVTELIRHAATREPGIAVHVPTTKRGEAALRARLGADAAGITFHRMSVFRQLPFPAGRAPQPDTIEIIVWKARFRWRDSRRIAIVQDLTTRIHPELHTPENIAEFEQFIGYVQRHATEILTVSESSRRDVIDHLIVNPAAVGVLPMPLHPQYVRPVFDAAIPARHGIAGPYLLAVGTLEPRKNLRRLVAAFESLGNDPALSTLQLVIAGPAGWDPGFAEFARASAAAARIRLAGFVPLADLPSLYHHASAVVYPSLYEGFGLPVLEAMCSSAIVLTSNVSSLPEVLGADGMLFDPEDTTAIAAAIRAALAMPSAEAARYRLRCRARAEDHLRRAGAPWLRAT